MQSEQGEGRHAYTGSALARLRFRSARGVGDRNRRCCTARVEHLNPRELGVDTPDKFRTQAGNHVELVS